MSYPTRHQSRSSTRVGAADGPLPGPPNEACLESTVPGCVCQSTHVPANNNSRGVRALKDGDHKSLFMNWLDGHAASVMKVARAYTLTTEECQDLAQEILLQAWRSLANFEGKASPATWFYRVALHTAMNWHRKHERHRSKQQPLLEVHAISPDGLDGAQQCQQRETVELLYKAIHQLPKTDAALVLLYLDEMSYQEMAEVLGIPEKIVGVKLSRAKKALGQLMNGTSHGD